MSGSLPAWIEEYRGKPFARESYGPDAFDCYGLVVAVLREQYGRIVPPLRGAWRMEARDRLGAALHACPWLLVTDARRPGDVVTYHLDELHCAVYVGTDTILHARRDLGVVTSHVWSPPWAGAERGTYRLERVPHRA